MSTFAKLYCAPHGCAPHEFQRKVFWKTLHWQAMPLAPLLLSGAHFAADHGLIDACGRATRIQQVYAEIEGHPFHPQNSGWLRARAKLRVSTRRLRKLAERYLAYRKRPRVPPNLADHPGATVPPATPHPREGRQIFRAAALRSLAPSFPITQLVRAGFLKPLRPFFQT